jgi:DNA-binding transcriptional regulator YdaS (Cro superfamily)
LRTDAYILSFPTGAQLRLINTVIGPDGTAQPAPNDAVLTETANLLDQYNALANEYNSGKVMRQWRWDAIERGLQDKLMALDKTLKNAVDQPGSSRSGAFQALRNSLRETGTLRGLKTDWRYWEMLGVSPAELEHAAKDTTHLGAWRKKGFSAREALSFRNAGYAPEQVLHLKHTGITGPFAKQLMQRGYTREFFEETLGKRASLAEAELFLQDHQDAWAENQGREFGSGACNTVTARFFIQEGQHPNRAVSTVRAAKAERIFKPEKFIAASATSGNGTAKTCDLQSGELVAGEGNDSGLLTLHIYGLIGPETLASPRIIGRNLASYRLAKAFGTDVIVESELAMSIVPVTDTEKSEYHDSTGRQAPDFVFMPGVMMEKADETYRLYQGAELVKPDAGSDAGAELCRNLTWLKLLDQISGQIDRHEDNMRLSSEGKVKGIDNDQSWPTAIGTPKYFGFLFEGLNWTLADGKTGYPRIVDEKMVASLCGFSEKELRQWRAGRLSEFAMATAASRARKTLAQAVKGCITKAEMQAGQRRLHALQAYLLGDTVKVISDWRTEYEAAARS